MIDSAITDNKWIHPSGHGVDGFGWQPISSALLRQHLAYVSGKKTVVWVDTMANVARYIAECDAAQLTLSLDSNGNRSFTVQCPGLDAAIYTMPLTIRFEMGGNITPTSAKAVRGATSLPILALNPGVILIDVVPGPGAVTVTYQ